MPSKKPESQLLFFFHLIHLFLVIVPLILLLAIWRVSFLPECFWSFSYFIKSVQLSVWSRHLKRISSYSVRCYPKTSLNFLNTSWSNSSSLPFQTRKWFIGRIMLLNWGWGSTEAWYLSPILTMFLWCYLCISSKKEGRYG